MKKIALAAAMTIFSVNVFAQYVPAGDTRGTTSVAAGVGSLTERDQAVAVGENSHTAFSGVSVGASSQNLNDTGVAIGNGATTQANFTGALGAIAIGNNSNSGGKSLVVGANAKATDDVAVVIGESSTAGYESVAVGRGASVTGTAGAALGMAASVAQSATNSVAIGSGTTVTQANTVAVGGRSISQLSDGVAPTDAVTVEQLNAAIANLTTH
ncbi:exported hypothetical protein [Paraburkholderia ribeironis]|uniref:Trimeric autotransporter adhesin YadA-like head domain-containing protein n=1 Tax=Paraburkholderia ribeironis TaxID=1247936 RepID=A0A1N7SBN2_9BURK|nr:hypothetical protein [Paraburkholderia ribeironis]SIT44765.1 exported hypothetical protein [Paraburkholderia ribeironis]